MLKICLQKCVQQRGFFHLDAEGVEERLEVGYGDETVVVTIECREGSADRLQRAPDHTHSTASAEERRKESQPLRRS